MRCIVLFAILALAGCSCEETFRPGEIVKHKTVKLGGLLVMRSNRFVNYEGYCVVSVREDGGRVLLFEALELERL